MQTYVLTQGTFYRLKLEYKANSAFDYATNAISVYWNEVLVKGIVPSGYTVTLFQTLLPAAVGGRNTLKIASTQPGSNIFPMTVENITLYDNLFINGDF